ncbi:MAG: MBL fold metallo-hydrolase [Micropepsaceae bacterium]
MKPWLKWTLRGLAALIAIGAAGYWWLLMQSGAPDGKYRIDLAEIRTLAASIPGAAPDDVRVEHVATLTFPAVAITAGDGWDTVEMPVYAYQLVYGDGTAIIDTAFDGNAATTSGAISFDRAAYDRVTAAMSAARFIVVTHEHMDHIGGLIAHPDIKAVLPRAILNPQQARDVGGTFTAITWPAGALDGYAATDYAPAKAIAPGVVLIRAPGHTLGSQIVYVRSAAGREYLFIGDVAWKHRNIELVRERARLVTWLMSEDRAQVLDELAELNRLAAAEPALAIVPGHDGPVIGRLIASGALIEGFR